MQPTIKKNKKPIILIFIANYLPGFKYGGIPVTVSNTVDHLNEDFEFKIITRDRDLNSKKPYEGIKYNQWQKVGNAKVLYLKPEDINFKYLISLIKDTDYNLIQLNSFFDSVFTLKVVFLKKMKLITDRPMIIAPRGELMDGDFNKKFLKKFLFVKLSLFTGFYDKLIWQASNELESKGFKKFMNVKRDSICIAGDLPSLDHLNKIPDKKLPKSIKSNRLKIIFLNRLTREKNLDYALKVIKKLDEKVIFDIYGPKQDRRHWRECEEIIRGINEKTKVTYRGSVTPDKVIDVFRDYDLFLHPTRSENYGHTIIESLIAGTPVLLSKGTTQWDNIEDEGMGWLVPLSDIDLFVKKIKRLINEDSEIRFKRREIICSKIKDFLINPEVLKQNIDIFQKQLV